MIILDALRALGCTARCEGDAPTTEAEYEERVFIYSGDRPTWSELQPTLAELRAAADAVAHVPERRAAYRSAILAAHGYENGNDTDAIGFVLDALIRKVYGDGGDMDALKAAIDKVKVDHPKNKPPGQIA